MMNKSERLKAEELQIKSLAAETIQVFFRRYKECKTAVKMRKIVSTEYLVQNMAAEIITNSMKRAVSRSRLTKSSSRHSSSSVVTVESIKEPNRSSTLEPRSSDVTNPIVNLEKVEKVEHVGGLIPILCLTRIQASGLANMCWQGVNDVYLVVNATNLSGEINWKFRTPTLHSAGSEAAWPDLEINVPAKEHLSISVSVYHECLAIVDKLIGSSTNLLLSDLIQVQDKLSLDLLEGKGARSKSRGVVSLSCQSKLGAPSSSCVLSETVLSNRRKFSYDTSVGEVQSVTSRSIDTQYVQHQSESGKSGKALSAAHLTEAMDRLNKLENSGVSCGKEFNAGSSSGPSTRMRQKRDQDAADRSPAVGPSNGIASSSSSRVGKSGVRSDALIDDDPSHQSSRVSVQSVDATSAITDDNRDRVASRPLRKSSSSYVSRLSAALSSTTAAQKEVEVVVTESASVSAADRKRFDEAFLKAVQQHCAVVRLTVKEFALVLDALDVPVHSDFLLASAMSTPNTHHSSSGRSELSGSVNGSINGSVSVVELPILHVHALASAISTAVRDKQLLAPTLESTNSANGFEMSERKARTAAWHLSSMVEGPFLRARDLVMALCCGGCSAQVTSGKTTHSSVRLPPRGKAALDTAGRRPSLWSASQVVALVQQLHIPADKFANVDGAALLGIDIRNLCSKYSVRPTLLQVRFAVYQQTLVQIESWWDRGIRPDDACSSAQGELSADKAAASEKSKGKRKKRKSSVASGNTWGSGVRDGALCDGLLVEIADCERLVSSLVTLNRAFGWGASIGGVTELAASVQHRTGKLVTADAMDAAVAGVGKWVLLNVGRRDALVVTLRGMLDRASDTKISSVLRAGSSEGDLMVFVPDNCLRSADIHVALKKLRSETDPIAVEDVQTGMYLRIAEIAVLQRTCQRFDWWDRPSDEVLLRIAGRIGEVVSTNELRDKQRVGVKILGSDVCDALPLEAFSGECAEEEVRAAREGHAFAMERKNLKQMVKSARTKSFIKTNSEKSVQAAKVSPEIHEVSETAVASDIKLRIKKVVHKLKQPIGDDAIKNTANVATGFDHLVSGGDEGVPGDDEGSRKVTQKAAGKAPSTAATQAPLKTAVDYSWLKPVRQVDVELEDAEEEELAVPHVAVDISSPRDRPVTAVRVVKPVQAIFDVEHAEYNDGIHSNKQKANEEGTSPRRPLGHSVRRPKSAPSNRLNASNKSRQNQQDSPLAEGDAVYNGAEGRMRRDPLSTEAAPFGVSGTGYGGADDPHKHKITTAWAAQPVVDPPLCKKVDAQAKAKRPSDHGERVLQARVVPQPNGGGSGVDLAVSGVASAPSKRNTPSSPARTAMRGSDWVDMSDLERTVPRPLSEYIAEATDTANASQTAEAQRKAELLHRETARSQKEADHKEKALLRELKRLNIHGSL